MEEEEEGEPQETFYFHHSCHGSTSHSKYLIDQQRKLKHVFIHNQPSTEFNNNTNLSLNELSEENDYYATLGGDDSLQLLRTNKEEMTSTPFVYPVLGVRDGLRVNFRIKLRGPVLQDVHVGSFTPNVDENTLSSSEYHDHMVIEVLGNRSDLGIVQTITLTTDEEEALVVYDLLSGIIINVPLFNYSYDEKDPDYGVGLNQLDRFGINYQTVNKFSGISSGVRQDAHLHAFSHQENEYEIDRSISLSTLVSHQILGKDYPSKVSLLNYLMVGHLYESFEVHEGMEIRPRFTGLRGIISSDTNTVNIVVFHSSCLGPGFTWDTRSEDMLQFISGKFPEWFSHFKENIVRTAEYNVKDSEEDFRQLEGRTDELTEIIITEIGLLRDMIRVQSENLNVSVVKIDEIFKQLTSFLNEIQHKLELFEGLFQDKHEVLTFEDVTAELDPIKFDVSHKYKDDKNVLFSQLISSLDELPNPDSFIKPNLRLTSKPIQLEELYDAMEDFDKSIGETFKGRLIRRNQSLRTSSAFQQYKKLGFPSILPSITDLPEPVRIFLQGLEDDEAKSIYPGWMTKKRGRAGSKRKKKRKKKQTKKKPKKEKKKKKQSKKKINKSIL